VCVRERDEQKGGGGGAGAGAGGTRGRPRHSDSLPSEEGTTSKVSALNVLNVSYSLSSGTVIDTFWSSDGAWQAEAERVWRCFPRFENETLLTNTPFEILPTRAETETTHLWTNTTSFETCTTNLVNDTTHGTADAVLTIKVLNTVQVVASSLGSGLVRRCSGLQC